MSAGKTSVVSAAKTSVVSADKRSAVCQDIPSSLPTQGLPRSGRPCVYNARGMPWQTADLLSADTTDALAADTTDCLPADTTHVLPADKFGVGNPKFERSFHEGFHFWCQGRILGGFRQVLGGHPCVFCGGYPPPRFRWEVSYEGILFQRSWKFAWG